jgi:ABC-2 type transport system ATP-binding protein
VRGPEVFGRIDGALRRVGLSDRANDRVKTYSQGMRQRLGVARCLLADPELLILDEPMNGLDPGGILEFRMMIGELTGEGRTVFLSSHLLDEVEKTCDAAAVIDRGRIIAQGPISELVRDEHNEVDIGCDDHHAALDLLDGHPAVADACPTPDGIRVTLSGIDGVASINARLVTGGVLVSRLEPVRESLEHRFLEMTSRVGGES